MTDWFCVANYFVRINRRIFRFLEMNKIHCMWNECPREIIFFGWEFRCSHRMQVCKWINCRFWWLDVDVCQVNKAINMEYWTRRWQDKLRSVNDLMNCTSVVCNGSIIITLDSITWKSKTFDAIYFRFA